MKNDFCKIIDKQFLVEQYVAGKLKGQILVQFEEHVRDCALHAEAVSLEKSLKRGVSDFARNEIRMKLRNRLKKREDTRFLILRVAAVLFVAVITPLIIYYQFNIEPDNISETFETSRQIRQDKSLEVTSVESEPVPPSPPASGIRSVEKKSRTSSAKIQPTTKQVSESKSDAISGDSPMMSSGASVTPKEISAPDEDISEEAVMGFSEEETLSEHTVAAVQKTAPAARGKGFAKKQYPTKMELLVDDKYKSQRTQILSCIENKLSGKERDEYALSLKIYIDDDGKVTEIRTVKTSVDNRDVETCILNIIKAWEFEAGTGESIVEKVIYFGLK